MQNFTGMPVHGDDFFDREQELRRLLERLATDHVLLLAPRRVGKTSLMYRLKADAEGRNPREHAVYLSVSSGTTEATFVAELCAALGQQPEAKKILDSIRPSRTDNLLDKFQKRLEKIKVATVELDFRAEAEADWQRLGRALVEGLRAQGGPWLLLVDELPLLVLALLRRDNGRERARVFLDWFRQLRQAPPDGPDQVRWLVAGSIGLDVVTRRYNLGATINDLALFVLGPFAAETADRLLVALGEGCNLPLLPAVRRRICERTEWLIPFHLQLLFSEVRAWCGDNEDEATIGTVDAAFEQLLGNSKRSYFDWWVQRLHEELSPPEDEYAIEVLNAAAQGSAGVSEAVLQQVLARHMAAPEKRQQMLGWLREVLVSDGYLVKKEGQLRFRSSLLRQFWQRRLPR